MNKLRIRHDLVVMLQVILASSLGALIGSFASLIVVMGFAAMILTPVLNVYYAAIFFICGGVSLHRMMRKNRTIQNDYEH